MRGKASILADAGYELCSHHLQLGELRYHYVDQGAGDPVVMVHGNPTWSFYFRSLIGTLGDEYRTIAPDHIGCGLSDKPDDSRYDYTLKSRVDDLEAFLEHLRVRSHITLVLHDWGGMIGMAYAVRHPTRVRRIVLLNTAAFHLPAAKELPWTLRACRNPWLGPPLVRGLNAFSRGAVRLCAARRPLTRGARQAYLAPYDSWRHRIAVLRFVQDIPLSPEDRSFELVSDVEAGLERFKETPMLICWGEKDFVFDRHFLDEWVRRFPSAEVHRYPDAGHYVLEDVPEEIAGRVQEFLARHPL